MIQIYLVAVQRVLLNTAKDGKRLQIDVLNTAKYDKGPYNPNPDLTLIYSSLSFFVLICFQVLCCSLRCLVDQFKVLCRFLQCSVNLRSFVVFQSFAISSRTAVQRSKTTAPASTSVEYKKILLNNYK